MTPPAHAPRRLFTVALTDVYDASSLGEDLVFEQAGPIVGGGSLASFVSSRRRRA